MSDLENLQQQLLTKFPDAIKQAEIACGELTVEVDAEALREVCMSLRDEPNLSFDQCMDVCGVDYFTYGLSEWETDKATASGFDRGVEREHEYREITWDKPRFAVVYHLLSPKHNQRLRLKVFVDEKVLMIDSVIDVWPSVNWFERETFDMFGILFRGHPDLRRILTDYGFIGHPFRKDFPLIGNIEVRYDAAAGRVIYEPVSIKPRILVPRVIREDNRYTDK